MILKEFIDITIGENKDPLTAITLMDEDGNWINWSELFILDYYRLSTWLISQIRVTEYGSVELTLLGGNFRNFCFHNVHSDKEEK